jgi:quercetin dioxygenase-like cupin family protein
MTARSLQNPVTRERFAVRRHGNGVLILEVQAPADMIRPPLHRHLHQHESFQVLRGQATVQAGSDRHVLEQGQQCTVTPGTPHTWWNSGTGDLVILAEFRPPGSTLSFFETFCGMASEGRCTSAGAPPFLQIAASARTWDMYLAGPPVALQRALFAALRPLSRLRGYRPSYDRFAAETRPGDSN